MQVSSITLPTQFDPQVYSPSLDITAVNPVNLVSGEEQTFTANTVSAYTFIMPSFGPFYADSLVVKIKDTNNVFVDMALGTDYFYAYPFLGASRALTNPVFSGILFNNIANPATVQLSYQALGGEWLLGQEKNAGIMLIEERNPCAVSLEQIAGYTHAFPDINVPWDRQDPTAMSNVIAKIDALTAKVAERHGSLDYSEAIAHVKRLDNPHATTKAQVSLGLVANLPPADHLSSKDQQNNSEYISSLQVHAMMLSGDFPASATTLGVAKLNLGTNPGDDTDSEKALTATGFGLISSNPESAINRAYNRGQLQKVVTPFPFTYPVVWNGHEYTNQSAFIAAVENFIGVSPLEYDQNNGSFWFPANTPLPDLTVTSA